MNKSLWGRKKEIVRPPYETFKGPVCRGSYALGNQCGRCEKCEWEASKIADAMLAARGNR